MVHPFWTALGFAFVLVFAIVHRHRGSRQDQAWWDEDGAAQLSADQGTEYWVAGMVILAASFHDRSWIDAAVAPQ